MESGEQARIGHLELRDFRGFEALDLELAPGLTVLVGGNGQGKTTVLEAVGWVARGRSIRGVPDGVLVRAGRDRAILRAAVHSGERHRRLEAEIRASGRNRVLLDGSPMATRRDLVGMLRVSVFAPDDLALVKGGPSERRSLLDETLAALAGRYDAACTDYERTVRHRNALLRRGVTGPDGASTLRVLDEHLVRSGAEVVRGRLRLITRLAPLVDDAYHELAGSAAGVRAVYEAEWAEGPVTEGHADVVADRLARALDSARSKELERRVTLVGPHRDEWRLHVGDLDARTHASQGEQRTLSLALRLATHRVVTDLTGIAPVLLLDDVFSELDPDRAAALVGRLPAGQTLLTTASTVPPEVSPERILRVVAGSVVAEVAR